MRGTQSQALPHALALAELIVIEAYTMKPAAMDITVCKDLSLLWQGRGKVKKCATCCRCLGEDYAGLEFRK